MTLRCNCCLTLLYLEGGKAQLRLLVVLGSEGGSQLSILPPPASPHSRPTHPSWTHPNPQNLKILSEAISGILENLSLIQVLLNCLDRFQLVHPYFKQSRQLWNCLDSFLTLWTVLRYQDSFSIVLTFKLPGKLPDTHYQSPHYRPLVHFMMCVLAMVFEHFQTKQFT